MVMRTRLSEEETLLLSAAAADREGLVRVCVREDARDLPHGVETNRFAATLADAWLLEYRGVEGGRASPYEPVHQLWRITTFGRVLLDLDAGRLELDPEDLAHSGCC